MQKRNRYGLGLTVYGQRFEALGDAEMGFVTLSDGTTEWVPRRRPTQS